ncbi:hypothetical protein Lepto7376_4026 [[Leptolyngbya] sp. PCC 7376]|uniref:hypothetical protein n=1 Tax=[Leptolyngbya] sp. PCC 7376 TaxID=111781 RepID=UPI00029F21BB|nr:hypothetical protein [[Leptolyngbya] sp. PCC 7376]AFY40162.1 hypothetical protein Lepto7376_4026 [[Leptolyngbya] sp. PCC 7376]
MQKSKIGKVLLFFPLALMAIGVLGWIAMHSVTCALFGSPHTSVSECTWRHLQGEPGATQDVNDAADILEQGSYLALEEIADEIFLDYATTVSTLPESMYGGWQVPIERLPERFHDLGGSWFQSPDLLLNDSESLEDRQLRLWWGNGRHGVLVFATPPVHPPEGFYVREVSPRTYVIANES